MSAKVKETATGTEVKEEALVPQTHGAVGPAIDFADDADSGFETVGARDMSVPFYVILQKTSPQVDEASDKYIEDAKPGMIMNSVTHELFDGKDGVTMIPCGFKKSLVEWKDRDSGGGLIGHHSENDPILKQCTRNAKNQLVAPNGNVIIDTAYHFVILVKPGGDYDWGVVGMSSTQLKASRNWILAMRSIKLERADGSKFTPAMFSHIWNLSTIGMSKDKYNWWSWSIKNAGQITDPALYAAARDFAKLIADGAVAVSSPPQESYGDPAPGTGSEVPF